MLDSFSLNVPSTDYLSFVFDGDNTVDENRNAYIDAEDPSRTLTISQTRRLVRQLIAGFIAWEVQSGDCVLLVLSNNIFYSSIFFGIIGAGGVCAGVNPASQVLELGHSIELMRPKLIITSHDVLPKVSQACKSAGTQPHDILVLDTKAFFLENIHSSNSSSSSSDMESVVEGEVGRWSEFQELVKYGEADWVRFSDRATAMKTPAAMFSTSGTSGLPKAAVSSHYTLISQHLSLEVRPEYEISRLVSLPFFHLFAAQVTHVWPIRNRQPVYVLPRFQPNQFLDCIQRFQITDTVVAPPIVHKFIQTSEKLEGRLDSIRWMGVGGAPISSQAIKRFEELLHPTATLSQVYGMTELGHTTMIRYPERQCWGSIGRPIAGYEIRLIDGFGQVIDAEHEPGSAQVRSHGMMVGYLGQAAHPGGEWYDTGDIMTRIEDKYFVVGRSKEMIKVNGWQVPPAELEAVLLTHPCIKDAAVVGTLRGDGVTEVPRAYIVRADSPDGRCTNLSTDEVYAFCRERLASYKALDGGVFFIDSIPKTPSGKIQRFKLTQMDRYRHSITELLMQSQIQGTSQQKQHREKINDLKSQAEAVMS